MSLYQDIRRIKRARYRRQEAWRHRWLAAYELPPERTGPVGPETVAAGMRKRPGFSEP